MDVKGEDHMSNSSDVQSSEEDETMTELRRGPWTVEEDIALINYIAQHGEGRWNSLARCAGLKRTGKSCRLRWLNYLRPDVRRGNITLEEQLLIIELHSRWGNQWSKIARHLPGRTDNEIKNYWRTRVQKHAKQLKCDVNSKQFKDTMRYLWMPRLVERIQAAAAAGGTTTTGTAAATSYNTNNMNNFISSQVVMPRANIMCNNFEATNVQSISNPSFTPENSSTTASSDSFVISQMSTVSDVADHCDYNHPPVSNINQDYFRANQFTESLISPSGYYNPGMDFQSMEPNNPWIGGGGDVSDHLWNVEDIWFLQQQFSNNI